MALMDAAKAKGDMAAYIDAENKREEKLAAMNAAGTNIHGYTSTRTTTPVAASIPTSYTGSTKATGGVSSAAQKIIDQMNANSLKWYTDPNNRTSYEQANQTLAQQLASLKETDANGSLVTYAANHNSASGEWTVTPNYTSNTPSTKQPDATAVQPQLEGLALGDRYGINYKQDTIQKLLDDATKAQYGLRNQQQTQSENKFYNNMLDTQGTALDTLRRAQASAVATGASRGMAAANELSAMLNLQQLSSDEATLLAEERGNLGAEEAAAYAKNASDSLTTSNTLKQAIAGLDSTKYGYDTQGYAAVLSYLAALADVGAQKYSSDSTLAGVKYNADANVAAAGKTYGTSGKTYNSGNTSTSDNSSPTSNPALADLDLKIAAGNGSTAPDGQNYTLSKNADGTYTATSASGSTVLTADQMLKVQNNGYNLNAALDENFGTLSYNQSYDAGALAGTKNWTRQQVLDYRTRTGQWPVGWGFGNGKETADINPLYVGTNKTNQFTFTGKQGEKISVGQGNYAVTWTYNAKTGVWTDGSGRTKNVSDFQTYVNNQPAAYVKKLN